MFKARQYENTICSSFNKCKEKSSFPTGLFLVAHHKETEDGRCIPLPYSQFYTKQGVCHTVAMPFTLKNILRKTKNYENSNISPCKNIIFK